MTWCCAQVHGCCMFAAFIVLFPLGVVTAHSFKNFAPWWFHVHRAVQCTGWAAALAGKLETPHITSHDDPPMYIEGLSFLTVGRACRSGGGPRAYHQRAHHGYP